jgi:broad specificity phosphatase PhoE
MKFLEIRRHSIRSESDKHINQEGVDLARATGNKMGKYKIVITSNKPRAFDTAIAMGYAVDKIMEVFGDFNSIAEEIKGLSFNNFVDIVNTMKEKPNLKNIFENFHKLCKNIVSELDDNDRSLIISHGGIIEGIVISMLPDKDYSSWGKLLECCEGVLIKYENGKFVDAELIRI